MPDEVALMQAPIPDDSGDSQPQNSTNASLEQLQAELKRLQSTLDGQRGYAKTVKGRADALAVEKQEMSERIAALEAQLAASTETLTKQLQEREKLAADALKKAEALERETAVSKIVLAEFPDLAAFYGKGLLAPQSSDPDEVRKYLAEFSDAAKSVGRTASLGSTPNPPAPSGKPTVMTISEALQHLNAVMKSHGPRSSEYQTAFRAYQEAIINGK